MAEVIPGLGNVNMPTLFQEQITSSSTNEIVILFIIGFLMLMTAAVIMFFVLRKWRWPYKVIIFENVSGAGYQPTRRDRARLIPFGDGGEELFFLQKAKKVRAAHNKRIGNKYLAWAIADDRLWYPITFGNLDKKLQELGLIPVVYDQRLSHSAIRKGIDQRYGQKSFMDKYGVLLSIGMVIIAIVILGAMIYINLQYQMKIAQTNSQSLGSVKEVLEVAKELLANANTVREGGTGLIPA